MLLRLVNVLAERRSSWSAIERCRAGLNILSINDHAVAEISRSSTTVSGARNDRRIGSSPEAGIEIGKHTVAIIRRSEVRVANAITQRQVAAGAPLILCKPLDRLLSHVHFQVEL